MNGDNSIADTGVTVILTQEEADLLIKAVTDNLYTQASHSELLAPPERCKRLQDAVNNLREQVPGWKPLPRLYW